MTSDDDMTGAAGAGCAPAAASPATGMPHAEQAEPRGTPRGEPGGARGLDPVPSLDGGVPPRPPARFNMAAHVLQAATATPDKTALELGWRLPAWRCRSRVAS